MNYNINPLYELYKIMNKSTFYPGTVGLPHSVRVHAQISDSSNQVSTCIRRYDLDQMRRLCRLIRQRDFDVESMFYFRRNNVLMYRPNNER